MCVGGGGPKVACITGRSRFGHSSNILKVSEKTFENLLKHSGNFSVPVLLRENSYWVSFKFSFSVKLPALYVCNVVTLLHDIIQ